MPPDVSTPPPDPSKIEETAELVKRLCLALTNVEMFSSRHPMAQKNITSAYEWLSGMSARRNQPIIISVSEKKIILDGLPLEDKNPLVAKLGAKLDEYHVTNLFFEPGVTAGEFMAFYDVLGKGSRFINEHGGLPALLAASKAEHIKLRSVSYVMVTEDMKVVSRDAAVVDAQSTARLGADADLVQYMIGKVLDRAEEQKWLIDEIKNNPAKMATLITEGIELATSRAESGMAGADDTVGTLLSNIKLVAQGMLDARPESEGSPEDVQRSIVMLENEIRMRSSKLVSSKVAQGLLNEILSVVAAYSDRVRAKQIADEFLKDESGLKRTEKLIRQLAPREESKSTFLLRMRDLLVERGMSQEDIGKLMASASVPEPEKPATPPKPRKPRKPVAQAVLEGVAKRLKELSLTEEQLQQATSGLSAFIEDLARQRAREFKAEVEQLEGELSKRNALLEVLPWGILLWDAEGRSVFVNPAGRALLGLEAGLELRPELNALLNSWAFPLKAIPDFPPHAALSAAEQKLLLHCFRTLAENTGEISGVILLPAR
jgi:PAS domain-containing protein